MTNDTYNGAGEPAAAHEHTPTDSLGPLGLLNILVRYRWLVLACAFVAAAVIVVVKVVPPRTYTASASFTAQSMERGRSDLGMMASNLGINMSGGETRSPEFYAEVLRSRQLQRELVLSRYRVPEAPEDGGADLVELFGVTKPSRDESVASAVRDLRDAMTVDVDPASGIVTLSVATASPPLSHAIAARAVELLNDFNVEQRQSQASAERDFVEGRLDEAREELQTAELRLERFLESNRRIESPELIFEEQRLQREVAITQERVLSLVRAYEQARVDEIRNLPVIVLLDPPVQPVFPDSRGLIFAALLGLLLGAGAGAVLAYVRHRISLARLTNDPDWQEFTRLRREWAAGLRLRRSRGTTEHPLVGAGGEELE